MTDTITKITTKVIDTASSDAVQQKVVSMLDALEQGAVQIGHTAVKYAPDVQAQLQPLSK